MEGNIYLCKKKKILGIYTLELFDNKNIKTKGINLEACKEDICMKIIEWNGDGEAMLSFIPDENKRVDTGVVIYSSLDYNDSAAIVNTNDLYTEGVCPKCKYALGERTKEEMILDFKPKQTVVGIGRRGRRSEDDFPRLFPKIQIYKKSFIDLLSTEEKKLFDTQKVIYEGEESNYVEVIPKKIIKSCSHKGADYKKHPFLRNWRCTECGREELHVWTKEYGYENRLVDLEMIKDLPSLFFLDTGLHISIVIRNDRLKDLYAKDKRLKLLTSSIIALDKECVECPNYFEEPEIFEW